MKGVGTSLVGNLVDLVIAVGVGYGLWRLFSWLLALAWAIVVTSLASVFLIAALLILVHLFFQFQLPKED